MLPDLSAQSLGQLEYPLLAMLVQLGMLLVERLQPALSALQVGAGYSWTGRVPVRLSGTW